MFKNLLGSLKTMVQSGDKKQAIAKLKTAVNEALADNAITAEEMASIQKLQTELGITEAEMADVKIQVLNSLVDKINADGSISEDELKIFNTIKTNLGSDYKIEVSHKLVTKEDLIAGINQVKGFLVKIKDKSVDLGGDLINKAKDAMPKKENTDNKEVK